MTESVFIFVKLKISSALNKTPNNFYVNFEKISITISFKIEVTLKNWSEKQFCFTNIPNVLGEIHEFQFFKHK